MPLISPGASAHLHHGSVISGMVLFALSLVQEVCREDNSKGEHDATVHPPVTAGVIWALWHLPAFFVRGGLGPFSVVGFVLFVVVGAGVRITWTWIFNKTTGSVLIIALVHAALNGTTVALPHHLPMISPAASLLFLGLTVVVFPVLILILNKGSLSYKPDQAPRPAETKLPTV